MNLLKMGAAIFLIIIIVLLSGCTDKTSGPVVPGAQVIPIPIPSSYIQDSAVTSAKLANASVSNVDIAPSAVNDTQLAANVLPYNVTVNTTIGTMSSASFVPIYNNGSITVNRTSLVVVQWSGEIGVNGSNSTYMIMQLGGVNMSGTPVVLATNGTYTTALSGTRTLITYNASVVAGTYTVAALINSTSASAVTVGRNVLITTAYPHS